MRLIPLGLSAAVVAGAVFSLAPPLTPRASAGCPGVAVFFARGTNEPPGVGRVGDAFIGSLRHKTSRSVVAYGVNYPANDDFLATTQGANDVSDRVQQMAGTCPSTKLVLGGYSQASASVHRCRPAPPTTWPPSPCSGTRPAGRAA